MGSITNVFSWVDGIYGAIPLIDLKFTCTKFRDLASPLLLDLNVLNTRILTPTNRESIIAGLADIDPLLVDKIAATIAKFSVRRNPIDSTKIIPVELTNGFCLLGTPVGAHHNFPKNSSIGSLLK